MREYFVTNPANREAVEAAFAQVFGDGPLPIGRFAPEVHYLPYLDARRIEERWKPPAAGRFTQYGPEDEAWMRPLGIGVYHVDAGPLIYRVRLPTPRYPWKNMF